MIVMTLAVVAVTAACSTSGPTAPAQAASSMPSSMPSSMSSAMPASMTQSRPVSTASSSTASSQTAAAVQLLDPAEFAAAIAGDRVTTNVHVPDEGSLPGTDLAVPFDQITARAAELPQDRNTPLAIYCMTGHMSAIAGAELAALGYTDIVELRGGMEAWQAAGRPLLPAGT